MVVVVVAPPVTSTGSAQPAIALTLPANAADVAGGLPPVARLDVTMWCDAAMLLLPCCCAGKADDAAASDA